MKYFQGINLKKLGNAATFLSFLAFSFLSATLLSPIVKSEAETIIEDHTIGAYTMSITNETEVDETAITGYEQKTFTAVNNIIFKNTCPKGAKISISTDLESNSLTDEAGHEIKATESGSTLSDDSWGVSVDGGASWNAVSLPGEEPIIAYNSTEADNEARIIPVLYGFRLSRINIPDGVYSTDVVYTTIPDQDCFIYEINWDAEGGEIPDGFPRFLNQDDRINLSALPRPTKNYYDFAGFMINGVTYTGDETDVDLNLENDPSITVSILWTPTNYPINFNLDGGSATNATTYNIESDSITLNNPARRGYTFRGWSGTDLTGDNNKNVTIPENSHGARSYTANWDTIPYNISYTLDGGSATNPTGYNVESSDITLNNPTKTAYDFVGWSGTDLTGIANKNVTISTGSIGNRSFAAHWTPADYSISYTLNGGAATNPATYNIESSAFTLNNPTRNHYDFKGWSGTGLSGDTNITATIPTGSYGNRSYTANWTPTNYALTYALNGGSATNPTGYNIESSAFTLNNPTRTAYDFAGWGGTELTGTGNKTVTIAQGSTGARSYTAYWTPTTYSITYNLDGGSVSGNPTTYNVETNTFTLANPTRANYNFAGWSGTGLTGTANTTVTVTKGSYGARTYTANWTPVQTVWNYDYTGAMQSFTASVTGTYKLEVWGAAGGGAQSASGGWGSGGAGGYAAGNVSLTAGSVVYIGVGGAGGHSTTMSMTFAGGWNGGGNGYGSDWAGNNRSNVGAGGGATHMGKTNTVLASTSVANLYIVAGGGGGAGSHGPSNGTGTGYAGGAGGTGGGGAYGVGSNSGGGGGYSGGTGGSGDSGARGGTSYVGGVTGGTTTAGARGGNGYARITWVSN